MTLKPSTCKPNPPSVFSQFEYRREKGTDIYLNVLDAQRSLYTAQQGLIAIRLTKLANQVRLYAVLGGGGDSSTPHKGE